jgi:hypothetical protein
VDFQGRTKKLTFFRQQAFLETPTTRKKSNIVDPNPQIREENLKRVTCGKS